MSRKTIFDCLENTPQCISYINEDNALLYCRKDEYMQTILHLTCEIGNHALAKFVIDEWQRINGSNKLGAFLTNEDLGGNTALHYACRNLHADCVDLLLQSCSKCKDKCNLVNRCNKKGEYPIHSVCSSKTQQSVEEDTFLQILRSLIEHGANINVQDTKTRKKNGNNPFSANSSLFMKSLLPLSVEEQFETLTVKKEGYTPLHYCAITGKKEAIRLLHSHGANFSVRDEVDGFTPLFLYIHEGIEGHDTLQTLLECGSKVECLNADGDSVLHYAVSKNKKDVVETLLNFNYEKNTVDHVNLDDIRYGAKLIHLRNSNGQTPLHIACREGHHEIVSLLLMHHFKQKQALHLNVEDSFGYHPFHEACAFGHLETVKQLVFLGGVDINSKMNCYPESTPLHIAASNGFKDIVQFLVQQNANILAIDADGRTPQEVASDDIKEFLQGFVQCRLVLERVVVAPRDSLATTLSKELRTLTDTYGPSVQFDYETNDDRWVTSTMMDDRSEQIARHAEPMHEVTILVSNTTSTGIRLKVREKGESFFKVIPPYNYVTMEQLKHVIKSRMLLTNPEKEIFIQRLVLLPDILLVDDTDIANLRDMCELEVYSNP